MQYTSFHNCTAVCNYNLMSLIETNRTEITNYVNKLRASTGLCYSTIIVFNISAFLDEIIAKLNAAVSNTATDQYCAKSLCCITAMCGQLLCDVTSVVRILPDSVRLYLQVHQQLVNNVASHIANNPGPCSNTSSCVTQAMLAQQNQWPTFLSNAWRNMSTIKVGKRPDYSGMTNVESLRQALDVFERQQQMINELSMGRSSVSTEHIDALDQCMIDVCQYRKALRDCFHNPWYRMSVNREVVEQLEQWVSVM